MLTTNMVIGANVSSDSFNSAHKILNCGIFTMLIESNFINCSLKGTEKGKMLEEGDIFCY